MDNLEESQAGCQFLNYAERLKRLERFGSLHIAPEAAKKHPVQITKYRTLKVMLDNNEKKCVYCGCSDEGMLTKDHYIPKSKGGSNDKSNLVLACHLCNFQKGDMLPLNFILWKIFQGLGPTGAETI